MKQIPLGYCKCGCGQKTTLATQNNKFKNETIGQPRNFVFGHNLRLFPRPKRGGIGKNQDLFWAKVDIRGNDECWNWKSYLTSDGYGSCSVDGKTRRAHRVSYGFAYGPIPKGMLVCHKCDNRTCVNPNHLYLGTPFDNAQDTVRKGRIFGAVLTDEILNNIKEMHNRGYGVQHIAKETGFYRQRIRAILRNL